MSLRKQGTVPAGQQEVVTRCYARVLHVCTQLCVSSELRPISIPLGVRAIDHVLVWGHLGLYMRLRETIWASLGSCIRPTCACGYMEV